MMNITNLIAKVFKPVHRHPQRLPHEWRSSNRLDPFRPLAPGEDGCGPVRVIAFQLDYATDGPVRIPKLELA